MTIHQDSVQQGGMQVFPIYLVLEESEAMKGARLDAVNSALPHIHTRFACDPIVDSRFRVGVISFSDMAEVLVPSTQLANLQQMPGLVPKGGINYTAAFTLVKACIQTDIDALKVQSFQVLRPCVFLVVSNDTPLDEWRDSYQALTGQAFTYRPHIIAFGFDVTEPDHIRLIRSLGTVVRRGEVEKRYAFGLESSKTPDLAGFICNMLVPAAVNYWAVRGAQNPTFRFTDLPEGIYDLDPM